MLIKLIRKVIRRTKRNKLIWIILNNKKIIIEIHLRKDVKKNINSILYNPDINKNKEPILFCLIKNGSYFIKSFMEHYSGLGFKNFIFIDNGSEDNTIALLKKYNVSILYCKLPYEKYKYAFKQYLVRNYSNKRWSLYVDHDELWDFPYSNKINLKTFINYLNKNNYNAVQAQMLDMFADCPLNKIKDFKHNSLKNVYQYYDTSGIIKKIYQKNKHNTINNPMTKKHCGGIRGQLFGLTTINLSKFPMIKWNKSILAHKSSHLTHFVNIADVSTVLLHYKFTSNFFNLVTDAVREENYWNKSYEYKKIYEKIKNNPSLNIKTTSARKYKDTIQLIKEGFLIDSSKFRKEIVNKQNISEK